MSTQPLSHYDAWPNLSAGDLKPADILFQRSEDAASRLIQLLDGTPFQHVALVVGPERVAESLLVQGVIEHGLPASVDHRTRVVVRRRPGGASMAPVVACAQRLASEDRRYAYEQVPLLALLCLSRRAPRTASFVPMVTAILDEASRQIAAALVKSDGAYRPLVCSGFVFACFAESGSAAHQLVIERFQQRAVGAETGSLLEELDAILAGGTDAGGGPASRVRGAEMNAGPASLAMKPLIEAYLREVEAPATARGAGPAAVPASDLGPSIRGFAEALSLGQAAARDARGTDVQAIIGRVHEVARQMITPRDLLESPSLQRGGRLK